MRIKKAIRLLLLYFNKFFTNQKLHKNTEYPKFVERLILINCTLSLISLSLNCLI
ncbi:hypothetical protein BCN_0406 [Bacillus cereus NC7401]|nr:hypothetical protein BCN_0406 [Bacillus cereus NC7401]